MTTSSSELLAEHVVLGFELQKADPRKVEAGRGQLGDALDVEKLEADYSDGVLTIQIPVLEAAQPRKIRLDTRVSGWSHRLVTPH